eukprot:2767832-Pyramimonas_sp.AAC.1
MRRGIANRANLSRPRLVFATNPDLLGWATNPSGLTLRQKLCTALAKSLARPSLSPSLVRSPDQWKLTSSISARGLTA